MTDVDDGTLHASAVAVAGRAVLIAGPPGSGKSDLALRLIDRGAVLVADDRTALSRRGDRLFAAAPDRIAGRIEVRGLGLAEMPFAGGVPVALLVEAADAAERMPAPGATRTLCGCAVPLARLPLTEASAPVKVELLLRRLAA